MHLSAVLLESYTVRQFVTWDYIDLPADNVALMSDCADTQTDLFLHCLHMETVACSQQRVDYDAMGTNPN